MRYKKEILRKLKIDTKLENNGATTGSSNGWIETKGEILTSFSPIDGEKIASIAMANNQNYDHILEKSVKAFKMWRERPAPLRGLIVGEITSLIRKSKEVLAKLITIETGKVIEESMGEIQEMLDIGDFAVGQSRQLYGKTMPSERSFHRIYEQWHPLGITGIITAFNFPVAVWSWNSFLAAICGNSVIWKPSPKAPLTALAIHNIIAPIIDKYNIDGVFSLLVGDRDDVGNAMINDSRIPLISATGSCEMGKYVGQVVAKRLGRSLLELGGNNAVIITPEANLQLAVDAIIFGAIGTAGQRCTTTRRIIIHRSIKDKLVKMLIESYKKIKIGNPMDDSVTMGPLIDYNSYEAMKKSIRAVIDSGGKLLYGGTRILEETFPNAYYVIPALLEAKNEYQIVQKETFAPVLYIISYNNFDEALFINNSVSQGLSSAIFTNNFIESEKFLSSVGSDCGLANVNVSTSGAEIGGSFGGEKDTGGGRESGSDSWQNYMRKQTNTINWGERSILAQGIKKNKVTI